MIRCARLGDFDIVFVRIVRYERFEVELMQRAYHPAIWGRLRRDVNEVMGHALPACCEQPNRLRARCALRDECVAF